MDANNYKKLSPKPFLFSLACFYVICRLTIYVVSGDLEGNGTLIETLAGYQTSWTTLGTRYSGQNGQL